MAELTVSRLKQSMTGSGFAGLLGVFAGLCAIFAGCVTVVDWYEDISQARWPVVSAVVERADVAATARAPRDGGGTRWQLRSRVRYQQDGEARTAIVTSGMVFSEADAAKLRSWAAQSRCCLPLCHGLFHCDLRKQPRQIVEGLPLIRRPGLGRR